MNTLIKTPAIINYSDDNYRHAVNYKGTMYNSPICLNYGEKHNRAKYILSAGTSDHITLLQEGVFIYVLAQNNGLQYISLQIINTETKEEEGSIFLTETDLNDEVNDSYGILDMDEEKQVEILMQYCEA